MLVLLPNRGRLISPLVGGRPPRGTEMPENEADWRRARPCGTEGKSVAVAPLSNLGKLLSDRRWWWPVLPVLLGWCPRCPQFAVFFPRPGVGSLLAPTGDPDSDATGDWPRFRVLRDGVDFAGGETSETSRAEDASAPGMSSSSHGTSGSSFGSPRVVTTKGGDSSSGNLGETGSLTGTSQTVSKESFLGDDAATFENKRRGFIPDR